MITKQDLQEAIAECIGQRDPNAQTCIKLAAYYTILKELYGRNEQPAEIPMYSRAVEPAEQAENYVDYDSGTEFSQTINGMKSDQAWAVIDELMDILQATNIRLYAGVIQKLEDV